MIMTKEQIRALQIAAQPLMEFLSDHNTFHPHFTVVVTSDRAEIMEGVSSVIKAETVDTSDWHVCHECDGAGIRP